MYFKDKNDTNIDDEFNNENNILSSLISKLLKYKFIIIISIIGVFLLIIMFLCFINNKITNYLLLTGDEIITIYQGSDYIEFGYSAYNSKKEDLTNKVIIKSNLNINKIGEYQICYTIGDITKTRIIKVVEKPKEYTFLRLEPVNNSIDIFLQLGEKYIEPGYEVFNSAGRDLKSSVKITGLVDTNKKGEYELVYTLVDSNNVTISKIRKVTVLDAEINLSLHTKEYTNKSVNINIKVVDDYFDYILLPNNEKIKISTYSYEVKENGNYTFKIYNVKGMFKQKTIEVNNIDRTSPVGSCSGSYEDEVSTINIKSSDNIGISKYVINGIDYTSNKIIINKKLNNVNIIIYDKAGNTNNISCRIVDNSFLVPIKPSIGENIIKQAETDKLKVYITKKDSYYITRIWAYNPHKQLSKFDSPDYGNTLYTPGKLLQMAINTNNFNDKLLVGFNASGFYLKDTYDASSVAKYSAYNKTSVGTLVITNGKVIRNAYDKAYKTWFVAGVDSDNILRIFTDSVTSTSSEINSKKQWAQEVINSGIRNTFTFASPLVINGIASNVTTSMPSVSAKLNRQAICQVNTNNFVLITGSNLNRNDLINIMLDLNCQTGTNLDGGGSIALLFKDKSSDKIETIIGNGRSLTEVGYFSE